MYILLYEVVQWLYLLRFYKSDILTIINFITDKHRKFKCLKIVIVNFLNIKNSF